ncbi:MAG: DUF3412 domain-containing protein [Pseudomonadales bacterium]|nr:DUF3412 domain-containing protein [Pseudomonadales bacterium]
MNKGIDVLDVVKHAAIRPRHNLNLLSQNEVQSLMQSSESSYQLFRACALAVLNTGSRSDDGIGLLETYADFDIKLLPQSRGFKLLLSNAPAGAFVDGKMVQGIQEHLFATLRDVVYCHKYIRVQKKGEVLSGDVYTDIVFRILRNADVVRSNYVPNLVVCWGGHSISRSEYDFSKEVGYELGLRKLDVATGCGIGAMKGPMKGAALGLAKQQVKNGRYIGLSEPGIIAAESPNALVNELVILPDIEKRLEAFVRLAHAIIVFPGGAGTAEEILYILSILMQPENQHIQLPLVFACAEKDKAYFQSLDLFLRECLGNEVSKYYQIISEGPEIVAKKVKQGVMKVHKHRRLLQQAYGFNWDLKIPITLQQPFYPSHGSMAALELRNDTPKDQLCVNLRAAFSGIVAGNVKPEGVEQIKKHGPYRLNADKKIAVLLDKLLREFVEQGRMSLSGDAYKPSFEVNMQ